MSARLIYRSAGACPPRALDSADDIKTGRALLHRFMKHPQLMRKTAQFWKKFDKFNFFVLIY